MLGSSPYVGLARTRVKLWNVTQMIVPQQSVYEHIEGQKFRWSITFSRFSANFGSFVFPNKLSIEKIEVDSIWIRNLRPE